MQSTPNRASDAGPESAPMDLTALMFEVEWCAEVANRAYIADRPKRVVRAALEEAKEAIERALENL